MSATTLKHSSVEVARADPAGEHDCGYHEEPGVAREEECPGEREHQNDPSGGTYPEPSAPVHDREQEKYEKGGEDGLRPDGSTVAQGHWCDRGRQRDEEGGLPSKTGRPGEQARR